MSKFDEESLAIYIREIQKYPLLTPEEEKEIARKARLGDKEARDLLINSHLRFVVNVAKAYQNLGTPLADLINEGNLGLVKAAERFDERKGVRFLSYAVWWIKQSIMKTVTEHIKSFRLPMSQAGKIIKVAKAESKIGQELGREPTIEEIAKELGLKPEEIIDAMNIAAQDISLDNEILHTDDLEVKDVIKDESVISPEELYFRKKFFEKIKEGLKKLTPRERDIIKLYFGLEEEVPHTLEDIGSIMKLSRERVRQIRNRAVEKLKAYYEESEKN
uniref:RNA polymerase sigma factor RpoD/SigA n=1 Tax=candidate division WOR-3 bacterium TaxID=2052148 RepID=A0A7C4YJC4_UNCW3